MFLSDRIPASLRFVAAALVALVLLFNAVPCASETVEGDVNGDGIVNIMDLVLVTKHVNNIQLLSEEQQLIADVNQDGVIDKIDCTILMHFILELINDFSAPLLLPDPEPETEPGPELEPSPEPEPGPGPDPGLDPAPDPTGRININTAGFLELQQIVHIGPNQANQIIEIRQTLPFEALEDLRLIAGIGEQQLQEIIGQGKAFVE